MCYRCSRSFEFVKLPNFCGVESPSLRMMSFKIRRNESASTGGFLQSRSWVPGTYVTTSLNTRAPCPGLVSHQLMSALSTWSASSNGQCALLFLGGLLGPHSNATRIFQLLNHPKSWYRKRCPRRTTFPAQTGRQVPRSCERPVLRHPVFDLEPAHCCYRSRCIG